MSFSKAKRLELYTLQRPQEVLLVRLENAGEPDQIMIFKGFSSSLMQATNFDPDVPLISESAIIFAIDRLVSPYIPNNPQYLQQGLTWEQMEEILEAMNI